MKKRQEIKILAIADMHWYTDEELNRIKTLDYDICVLLGDINESVIRFIKRCCGDKPLLAVAGNHDEWNTPENAGAENIHCKCKEYFGYRFAGISGSVRYKDGDIPMLTQRESIEIAKNIEKADILLSHDSMYHLFGKESNHCGLIGINLYNWKNRVKLNVCGHHHISAIKKHFGTTTACVFRCAIISLPDKTMENIF